MTAFREELEFIANTVVFILAGIVIAGRIYESSSGPEEYIHPSDWGYTLLLWVYLTVCSLAYRSVLCIFLPSPSHHHHCHHAFYLA